MGVAARSDETGASFASLGAGTEVPAPRSV